MSPPVQGLRAAVLQRDPEPDLAAAIKAHADAMNRLADQVQPIGEFFAGASGRLDHLCAFLKAKGPWLLGLTPGVLVAIGAISPNAAGWLKTLVAGLH